jgi:magnesium transporter
MLQAFVREKEMLAPGAFTPEAAQGVPWLDLHNPTEEERAQVERQFSITLPSRSEMHDIELSSRFYEEREACFLTATVLTGVDSSSPELHSILFVLKGETLITLRHSAPQPLRRLIERIGHGQIKAKAAPELLLDIAEGLVGRVADTMQSIEKSTEILSRTIIHTVKSPSGKHDNTRLSTVLCDVNAAEDLLSKGYQSLFTLQLLLDFLQQSEYGRAAGKKLREISVIEKDIRALIQHGEYLTQKLEFLLESTLGVINIEQNNIIKMFTVLAMIFMPPTLIASMYGMNFLHMPELGLRFGYPLAIVLMIISSWIPYRLFRRRGWI